MTENSHYEQFLLFPQCFPELVLQTHENQGLFGKGLIDSANAFHEYTILLLGIVIL